MYQYRYAKIIFLVSNWPELAVDELCGLALPVDRLSELKLEISVWEFLRVRSGFGSSERGASVGGGCPCPAIVLKTTSARREHTKRWKYLIFCQSWLCLGRFEKQEPPLLANPTTATNLRYLTAPVPQALLLGLEGNKNRKTWKFSDLFLLKGETDDPCNCDSHTAYYPLWDVL